MPSISNFCSIMRMACEDWSLGYDQSNRWDIRDGGECDCSSLVIWALKAAGFDVGSASYTGDLSENLTRHGWKRLPFSITDVRAGDILLNDTHHVCAVISGMGAGATIAQASIDERGRISGGAAGDQTGGETNTRRVYTYSRGWDCILRYVGGNGGAQRLSVDGYAGPATVAEWQRQLGTPADGKVSGQASIYAKWYPRLTSVEYGTGGSTLMAAVQRKIGVTPATGVIARGTVCVLQGWLVLNGYDIGSDTAGKLGAGTAKALQASLYDGAWL